MTKEEVKALIKAKIEGQGTNVDAGSVLPLILNGIIDLIDEGGGGTSDAVQYVPQELTAEQQAQARTNIGAGTSNFNGNPVLVTEQELTESQKMQARKNQGLYYSEGTPAGVISWDGNTEGKESFNIESFQSLTLYKIADSPAYIPADKISSVLDASGNPISLLFGEGADAGFELISGTIVAGFEFDGNTTYAVLILDSPQSTEPAPYDGLTGVYVTDNVRTINYDAYGETIHHIEPKYIKDMYYEEEGTQSIQWDGDTSVENASFPIYSMMPITCYKASDLVPSLDDVVTFGGAEPAYTSTKGNFYIVEGTENKQCCIVFKDYEGLTNEVNVTKGIYFSSANTPLVIKSTTIHKIPSKYLPDTSGGDAVQYVPQELTEAQQMQARKNQDLYYEEEVAEEKETPSYDGGQTTELYKLSDDTPAQEDIIGVRLNGTQHSIGEQGLSIVENDYGYDVFVWNEGEGTSIMLFTVNLVDDMEVGTGIFLYPYYYENYSQRLIYNDTVTEVHQIPAKYLPDVGGGAFIVTATYDYQTSSYSLNKTYAEVAQAVEDGKVVILEMVQVAGNSNYFPIVRNATTQGAANEISFAGLTNSGSIICYTLKADDSFVQNYAFSPTAEIEFQYGATIEDGGCGLVEINSTTPVIVSPTIIGNGGKYANATWSVKRISGSAVFAMTGIDNSSFSITASETGVSQAIVSCEYTSSSILGTITFRLSAIITAVATI